MICNTISNIASDDLSPISSLASVDIQIGMTKHFVTFSSIVVTEITRHYFYTAWNGIPGSSLVWPVPIPRRSLDNISAL